MTNDRPISRLYLVMLAAAGLAWLWILTHEPGMNPSLPVFVATWTVMMAAMMLPSVLPGTVLFATVSRSRAAFGFRPVPSGIFVTGYLGVWAALGIAVGLVAQTIMLAPEPRRIAVGIALLFGGGYQLTPLKSRCLAHCRSPLHLFMHRWSDGVSGAIRLGVHHGLYCVACCWGLMAALIALGMMRPAWMGVVALAILAEKILPRGRQVGIGIGILLGILGMLVLLKWQPGGMVP